MSEHTQTDTITPDPSVRPAEKKPRPTRKQVRIVIGAVAAALLILYGIGVHYYGSHFNRNQKINNIPVGNMTVPKAQRVFTEDYKSHSVSLVEKERTETIDATKLSMSIDVGSQVSDLFAKQNKWLWFANLFSSKNADITLDITYDDAALESEVDNLVCFDKDTVTAPEDAYIQAGETQFEIVPEVLGNTVRKKKLLTAIREALTSYTTEINLEESGLYKLPDWYEKDDAVQNALATANKYTGGTITYDFDYTTETVDYKTSSKWIRISDDFEVSFDKDKVLDYIYSLAEKYNTMGGAHNFTTSSGEKIRVVGGDYGWKIDSKKEQKKLISLLKKGVTKKREPAYEYSAAVRTKDDDIGDSYVEVNITYQEVWLYVDGKCIMNDSCVTGDPTKGHDTYTGVYGITYKQHGATLTGPDAAGGTYASKVSYWMPFDGNQGLHDATWRSSFGGSEYKGNGSHGCVNLPVGAAATLFKYVDEGFPVVVYKES